MRDLGQIITCTVFLIPGSLVDQGDDADAREAADKDFALIRDVHLI